MFSISDYVRDMLSPVYDLLKNGLWALLMIPLYIVIHKLVSVIRAKAFNSRVQETPPTSCSLLFVSKRELMEGYQEWLERRGNEAKEDAV